MDEHRRELYEERAEWADLESDVSEARKYAIQGGWFWRFCDWIDRVCRQERAEVQAEIERLDATPAPETEGDGS